MHGFNTPFRLAAIVLLTLAVLSGCDREAVQAEAVPPAADKKAAVLDLCEDGEQTGGEICEVTIDGPEDIASLTASLEEKASRYSVEGAISSGKAAIAPRLVAISVADVDASAAWYAALFGFEETARYDFPDDGIRLVFLARDGFELELIEKADSPGFDAPDPDDPATRRGFVKLAFATGDIDALWAAASQSGVSVQSSLRASNRTGGRFFILRDPDGNWVQVFGP